MSIQQEPVVCAEQDKRPSGEDGDVKPRLGVYFSQLDCFGFLTSAQYQATVASYLLAVPLYCFNLFRSRAVQKIQILRGFEGLIHPGEMLLVLGRPGSSCSTFLKTLAGETNGFEIGTESSVCYQGIPFKEMHDNFKDQRIYLAELDVHFPELTLGQTLSFAVSSRKNVSIEEETTEITEKFRLTQASGTRIGSDMLRGVSGGEKRRTSIAEAFISGAQIQCWDNSTRGLDSFTALNFVKILRDSTNLHQSTVLMSLYQASERMYNMFDKVILLYEGRQIYFGPAKSAVSYFTSLGFIMPRGATAADFLTSLTNPAERIINPDHQGAIPRLPDEFANVWKHSQEAKALRDEITKERASFEKGQIPSVGDTRHLIYSMSCTRQVTLCIKRAIRRIQNESGPTIGAIIANLVLGLVVGSAFYNLPNTTDSFQQRAVVIFFSLIVNSFSPAYEITMMWTSRPIIEKQHRYAFYRPSMDGIASIMSEFPNKLASSLGLHLPIYFLANLKLEASGFFIHWLFMLINMLTMSMIFRVTGSLSRVLEESIPPVSILSLLCVVYSGFVVPPDYMRPWLAWFWRINPVAYTYEGLMINEFRNRQFTCSTTIPTGPTYTNLSSDDRICAVIGSESGQDYVDGSRYLSLKYGYTADHLWRNLGVLFAMTIPLFFIYLVAVECVPARPSRGEVLFFKRRRCHRRQPVLDNESGNVDALVPPQELDESQPQGKINKDSNEVQDRASLQGATFQWESLSYTIKTPGGTKTILSNINGWVTPGTLTALMGTTGAGKTALLDTLAGRITAGVITGDIYVNGHQRDLSFKRRMGYVQQSDIHLHTTTVREALQFSALLRQPKSISRAEKLSYVEEVLDIMDMKGYADAIVGVPGEGLNVEQRKRLTIAVEMASKPDLLLFLDEPTSGLDSQTAWSICTLLRKLAASGQTILCTIHQPSSQLFFLFDRLLLMGKGGTTLYFGEIGQDASTVIKYFEEQGATPCKAHENPAEWILEVTGNAVEISGSEALPSANEEWTQRWERSHAKEKVIEDLNKLKISSSSEPVACSKDYQDAYAATSLQQILVVSNRIFVEQWRDPSYTLSKIALCISISLLNGISFYNINFDIQGLTSVIFSTFLLTQLFSCINQLIIPRFVKGRQLFEARERHANSYSWSVFVASNILTELSWQTAISAVVFVCWYYPVGLHQQNGSPYTADERGALSFILIWLFNLWANTMSQAFGAGIEHGELVAQVATLCFWLSLVFCGILVPPDSLRSFWIWMYRISPLTYLIEGLTVAGLGNATITCSDIEILDLRMPESSPTTVSCKEYLKDYISASGGYLLNPEDKANCQYCPVSNADVVLETFGMKGEVAWRDVGIMAGYVAFNVLATFAIYWLVRVPKDLKRNH